MKAEHIERAIDRYLDIYDVRNFHAIVVDASPVATYRAAREMDLGRSVPIATLVAIRAIPHFLTGKARPTRSLTLDSFLDAGFTIFEDRPPEELVMGVVGKFWRPDSGLVRVTPEEFRNFDEPGFAKAVVAFFVDERDGGSALGTETRVATTDASARRKFGFYWRVIGPFSGLIRRIMLDQVKGAAES